MRKGQYLRQSLAAILITGICSATDFYVDNQVGDDAFDGTTQTPDGDGHGPDRTFAHALKQVGPGDTLHLNPTGKPYRQMINLYGHPGGTAEEPIVIDGHGALLSGAEICPPQGWEQAEHGFYVRRDIQPRTMIIVNGTMVFGGNSSLMHLLQPGEFHYAPYFFNRLFFYPPPGTDLSKTKIEVGQPDGTTVVLDATKWQQTHSQIGAIRRYNGLKPPTWVKLNGEEQPLVTDAQRLERLSPGMWCVIEGAFYYQPQPGVDLKDLDIRCVVRENGVQMNGNTAHVVIRNLTVRYVANDGYNIHGAIKDAVFENCNAHHCGDEGFSSHDDCETVLDGAVYEYCDNGICNVNRARSVTRNVIITNSRHIGFGGLDGTTSTLENCILIDNPSQVSAVNLTADNLLILRTAEGPATSALGVKSSHLKRLTVVGNSSLFRTTGANKVRIENSLWGSGQGTIHIRHDEPEAILTLAGVTLAPGQIIEWGARYPWKTMPIVDWVRAAEENGGEHVITVSDTDPTASLQAGRIPEDLPPNAAGCTRDLLTRWVQFAADKAAGTTPQKPPQKP